MWKCRDACSSKLLLLSLAWTQNIFWRYESQSASLNSRELWVIAPFSNTLSTHCGIDTARTNTNYHEQI
jgi:hypothetical protein